MFALLSPISQFLRRPPAQVEGDITPALEQNGFTQVRNPSSTGFNGIKDFMIPSTRAQAVDVTPVAVQPNNVQPATVPSQLQTPQPPPPVTPQQSQRFNVGQFLGNPAVQQGLGQFAQAFGQGDPNNPATILGGAAIQGAQQNANQSLIAAALRGEDLSQFITAQASPEAIQQAVGIQARAREEELQQSELEQQRRVVDIREQEARTAEQARQDRFNTDIIGLDLRESQLTFEEQQAELDNAVARQRLQIEERRTETERRIGQSLIDLREAQIAAGENLGGAPRGDLNKRRTELASTLGRVIEDGEARLQAIDDELNSAQAAFDRATSGLFASENSPEAVEAQQRLTRAQTLKASQEAETASYRRMLGNTLQVTFGAVVENEPQSVNSVNEISEVPIGQPFTVQDPNSPFQGRTLRKILKDDGTVAFEEVE